MCARPPHLAGGTVLPSSSASDSVAQVAVGGPPPGAGTGGSGALHPLKPPTWLRRDLCALGKEGAHLGPKERRGVFWLPGAPHCPPEGGRSGRGACQPCFLSTPRAQHAGSTREARASPWRQRCLVPSRPAVPPRPLLLAVGKSEKSCPSPEGVRAACATADQPSRVTRPRGALPRSLLVCTVRSRSIPTSRGEAGRCRRATPAGPAHQASA